MDGDPRNIARNVGYALVVLVPDEALGDDVEGLRNIDQRCVGLSRNRRAVGIGPDRARARVLRVNGCRWLRLWKRRWRRGDAHARGPLGAAAWSPARRIHGDCGQYGRRGAPDRGGLRSSWRLWRRRWRFLRGGGLLRPGRSLGNKLGCAAQTHKGSQADSASPEYRHTKFQLLTLEP